MRFWIKRFLEQEFDGLPGQPHPGQSSALTPALAEAIRTELRKTHRTWTAPQLAAWRHVHHGVQLTPGWLAVLLKRAEIAYKRTTRTLKHKQDAAVVAAKQAELQELKKGARKDAWTSGISTKRASRSVCP